jgi:hypothetical protein
MSRVTTLDAQFADGNVPLGVLLGAIGALSAVRALLPHPTDSSAARLCQGTEPESIEPFVELLLGVVALHDRLTNIVDGTRDSRPEAPRDREAPNAPSLVGLAR